MKDNSFLKVLMLAGLSCSLWVSAKASAATFTSRATSYYPHSSKMEGGYKDRIGKRLYTLQAYLRGQAPYVSVAMDKSAFKYGTKIRILELEQLYKRKIEFRVVDTGGRFQGRGRGRIDICTETRKDTFHPSVNRSLTVTTNFGPEILAPSPKQLWAATPKTEVRRAITVTPVSGTASRVNSRQASVQTNQSSQDVKSLIRSSLLDNREVLNANPRDMVLFCKNYYDLNQQERADVWTEMMLAMAQASSQMNSKKVSSQGRDSSGNAIYGRGLLQISSASARGYRCDFNQSSELNNDATNIKCGIKIIERLITRDDEVGNVSRRGLGRYWGSFRESSTVAKIKSRVSQISSCSGSSRVAGSQSSGGVQ